MSQASEGEHGIGFYTVQYAERTGWTGGYLLLNRGGRPLEFHCTLPVRPSRAHEILYGPTLRGHLIGETIGPVLLRRSRLQPMLVCCDQPEALVLGPHSQAPVGLVADAAEGEVALQSAEAMPGWISLPLAGSHVRVPMAQEEAARAAIDQLTDLPDLLEPFMRIREAIREAQQQVARPAA